MPDAHADAERACCLTHMMREQRRDQAEPRPLRHCRAAPPHHQEPHRLSLAREEAWGNWAQFDAEGHEVFGASMQPDTASRVHRVQLPVHVHAFSCVSIVSALYPAPTVPCRTQSLQPSLTRPPLRKLSPCHRHR
eukprot:3937978-Rhodomonas_salina.1